MFLSYIIWKISKIYMHYLPDKKLKHFPGYGPDWLTEILVNHGLDLSNKFGSSFFLRMIRVKLLSCRTFIITIELIQLFSNPPHCPYIDTQTLWNLHPGAFGVNATLSSSSCRAISMDIPDPLLPCLPIVHHIWQVLRAAPCILTELLYVGLSWPLCFCMAMWRGP